LYQESLEAHVVLFPAVAAGHCSASGLTVDDLKMLSFAGLSLLSAGQAITSIFYRIERYSHWFVYMALLVGALLVGG
jgi:hypothetical protein